METGDPRTGGEPDPQAPDAAARRAEADLAALRAERRPAERAPPRRTALLAFVLLALLVALAARWALRHREPPPARTREAAARTAKEKLSRIEAQEWSHVEILAPREQLGDPASGEASSPFQGFAISVSSSPAGARVLVDGDEKGETPLAASVDCEPGHEVQVRVEKAGYRPQRRAVRCRADALVRLSVRLQKAAAVRR